MAKPYTGFAVVLAAVALTATAAAAARFSYIHVEANEGDAAGGHAALRFDDEVFHFQHNAPGVIRLRRDDWRSFLYTYAILGNRGVNELEVETDPATLTALVEAFHRRALLEGAQFERLQALQADTVALDWQVDPQRNRPPPIAALGLFEVSSPPPDSPPVYAGLRAALSARYGEGFLDSLRRNAEKQAQSIALRAPNDPAVAHLGTDPNPLAGIHAGLEYADVFGAQAALTILARDVPVKPEAIRHLTPPLELTPSQAARVRAAATALQGRLVSLLGSRPPGWPLTALVALARLQVLRSSADAGELVVLDSFPDDAPAIAIPDSGWRDEYLASLTADATAAFETANSAFLSQADGFDERSYAAVESSANRLCEVQQTRRSNSRIRVNFALMIPSHGATVDSHPAASIIPSEAQDYAERARANQVAYQNELYAAYRYDVLTRNCVSELFAVVDTAELPSTTDEVPANRVAVTDALGSRIAMWPSANIIPFVSAASVRHQWPVVAEHSYPAFRLAQLEARADNTDWINAWRERTVLTSSVYRPTAADSAFLLFTDDTFWWRPLLGLGNLTWAFGNAVVGAAMAPFDASEQLSRSGRGLLFSLPELAFMSLRKGSMPFVRQSAVDLLIPPAAAASPDSQ